MTNNLSDQFKLDLSDLTPKDQLRYIRVKNMSKAELTKLEVHWALDNYYDTALAMNDGRRKIVEVDLYKVIERSEFLELSTKTMITDHINDFRYVDIIERWEQGLPIDPPLISFAEGELLFEDGRHRTIAAYHIGETTIPVAVYKWNLEEVKSLS